MTTIAVAEGLPAIGLRASKVAPIIVASDGEAQSVGALVIGRMLAGPSGAMRLVSVLKPMPAFPDSGMAYTTDIDQARRGDLHRHVLIQTGRVFDTPMRPEILSGDPAAEIARLAHEADASLIVCGLGRHNVVDRILGDETALRLVRIADAPVLAVPMDAREAPASILVACDFSETSLRAARLAVALAAPGATIYLAHVAPAEARYEWDGWGKAYKQDAFDALRKMKSQLRPAENTIVQTLLLEGDPATELMRFGHNAHVDLIATGSHGHGFVTRMLVGSVATRILRAATCAVLTVPHAAVMTDARTMVVPPLGHSMPRSDWGAALSDFSSRNAGRLTLLEVDDAEIGAQAQEFDYPFRGATYDRNDDRISLMFGNVGGTMHLTRGIADPSSVDLLTESDGRDVALRIGHGKGQTLLTFVG
jgi:nucleotide-binding universal stress UspA family protein